MGFLEKSCTLFPINNKMWTQCQPFSCGDNDLDEFFLKDADNYNKQLLGRSFCYRLDEDLSVVVCAFTLTNSSIESKKLPNNRRRKLTEYIPHEKSLSSYPAVLIGRLGVNEKYRKKKIGTELIDFIKLWFISIDNKSGCRYLTVDAYNNDGTKQYYEYNGFQYLFSSEKQEKEYIGLPEEKELKTRLMYFDLIRIQ
jgi:GNAT superfamily N-acetyltransferase